MKNIEELTNDLVSVYEELRAGAIKREEAAEINNTAGKIMSTMKLRLAYHALRGEAPDIPFLASPVGGAQVIAVTGPKAEAA